MRVRSVAVDRPSPLEGADFADAFHIRMTDASLDAPAAARLVTERQPSWVSALLVLRNWLVAPFGLKPGSRSESEERYGIFPVLSRTPSEVVLGMDDRHLDFRLVISVAPDRSGRKGVTATTFVRTHNCLGRAYLAAVMPFHKIIVPTMLASVNRGR
jgi:hypothetical protein